MILCISHCQYSIEYLYIHTVRGSAKNLWIWWILICQLFLSRISFSYTCKSFANISSSKFFPNFSHIRYTCNNVNVMHTATAYVQPLGLCLGWQTNFHIIVLLTIHLSLLSFRSKTLITVLFNSFSKFLELLSALSWLLMSVLLSSLSSQVAMLYHTVAKKFL